MKKILLLIFAFQSLIYGKAAVTYDFSGGRFGDNLVSFMHALWVSYIFDMPLIYKPFKYSDGLILHAVLKQTSPHKKVVHLSKGNMTIDPNADVLYVVPYFAEAIWEHHLKNNPCSYIKINWDNEDFYKLICSLVKPIQKGIAYISKDRISVAMHIRKGGGFDAPLLSDTPNPKKPYDMYYGDYVGLLKFPPEGFYIEQLKKISEYYGNKPLYVYVFTDDRNPYAIAQRIKNQLQGYKNIEIDYRSSENYHDSNVLDDFFAMSQFDCLIRPESNYSICAAKLGRHDIEIFPTAGHWEESKWYIDSIKTITNRIFNNNKEFITHL